MDDLVTEQEVSAQLAGFFRTWLKVCKEQPDILKGEDSDECIKSNS